MGGKVIPLEFKQWCHGYVITSHKAQGVTAKAVVVAAAMLDQNQLMSHVRVAVSNASSTRQMPSGCWGNCPMGIEGPPLEAVLSIRATQSRPVSPTGSRHGSESPRNHRLRRQRQCRAKAGASAVSRQGLHRI